MATALRVNPTRMELTRIKRRLVTAKRGHKLLKDKRDEMVRQFIVLVRQDARLRKEVEQELKGALGDFALARAVMDSQSLEEAIMYPARSAAIELGQRNVLSVHVPTITAVQESAKNSALPYGLAETSADLDDAIATMAALLCIGFLFMLQTYVATIIQPDMSKMNPDTAFFDAAELAAGDWFRKVLLVVNILAVGICSYFQRVLFGVPTTPLQIDTLPKLSIPLLSKITFIGEIFFQQNILTYMAYILIPVSIFVLYKTSLGLAIRSTGENPVAVDVAGLPVNRIRFLTVLVAGCIGGLAGSFYTVGYLGMFSSNIIGGRGWIAFAICFLGNWSPKGAVLGTLAFGLADALSIYFRTGTTAVPTELIIALPYILTIVLTIFRSNFRVPAKLGVPYRKEG